MPRLGAVATLEAEQLVRLEQPRKSSLRSLQTSKLIENDRSDTSRRRNCSRMLAPKPLDVENDRTCSLRSHLTSTNAPTCSLLALFTSKIVRTCSLPSRIFRKQFHGAARVIEKEFEKSFEKGSNRSSRKRIDAPHSKTLRSMRLRSMKLRFVHLMNGSTRFALASRLLPWRGGRRPRGVRPPLALGVVAPVKQS